MNKFLRRAFKLGIFDGNNRWYLAGGVPKSSCVAAYQPIGASSYANSLINLVNPGTYDATKYTTLDVYWRQESGWWNSRFHNNFILRTGIIPAAGWTCQQ
jgi:hypothetical protein